MKTLITIVIALTLSLWVTHAHKKTSSYNLSDSALQKVEQRLERFFDTVESYSETRQERVYNILDERIEKIINKYNDGTPQKAVLDILQISDGTDYHIPEEIEETPVIESPVWEESVKEEKKEIYRADLDSDNLNEFDKDILAGLSAWVLSLRVRANLEPIETERVEVTFNQDIDNIGLKWNLYHDWELVWQASSSDVRDSMMIFDNMTNLTIWETTSYLQLEIVTETIWRDKLGQARDNIMVTRVSLQENKWTITWDNVWNKTYRETSRAFSIVPVKISTSVESEFEKNKSTSRVKISANAWSNNDNGNGFSGRLTGITVEVSAFDSAWEISVLNGNGTRIWSANIIWSGEIMINLIPDSISSRWEVYELITDSEAIFRIPQDGIIYSAGSDAFTSNLDSQIFLGQR